MSTFREALTAFANELYQAFSIKASAADPEDQLKPVVKELLESFPGVQALTEVRVEEGRPDLGVFKDRLLVGFIELKAPGRSIDPKHFRGHDKHQWERFRNLPNLIYTNGRDWVLYRQGESKRRVSLPDDPTKAGRRALSEKATNELEALLRDFLNRKPKVPREPRKLAEALAPLTRLVRMRVEELVKRERSELKELWKDWRQTLFPDADEARFADAYAQTLTFALLLARVEGARDLTNPYKAARALRARHNLLSAALKVLTYEGEGQGFEEIRPEYLLLARIIQEVKPGKFKKSKKAKRKKGRTKDLCQENDPWLCFYEDFLAVYDPKLRKDYGVYYTPAGVVGAMVRLTHDVLRNKMGRRQGFAEHDVLVLDPAAGTGTFPLAVFDLALKQATEGDEGSGYGKEIGPAKALELAERLFAFEILISPYAVAHLRLQQAFASAGAPASPKVYLTDTLEAPDLNPLGHSGVLEKPLVEEHKAAMKVKRDEPILVIIGNPPYDRHDAEEQKGGWIRSGLWDRKSKHFDRGSHPLEDFLKPAREAGAGRHLKNLYNLYVYFWRWALWKAFEAPSAPGPGIVTFITASSYLRGPGFMGMRKFMREVFDELWIIDLGGDNRAPSWAQEDENVFNIETPVAIAIGARYQREKTNERARVHYTRLRGSREEKLERLSAVSTLEDLEWAEAPDEPFAPFVPGAAGDYARYPRLKDLFPWQHSGVEFKRTWPIAPDQETLRERWRALLAAPPKERGALLREDRDLKASSSRADLFSDRTLPRLVNLATGTPPPPIVRYGFRSLDRQWAILDPRVCTYPRTALVRAHGPKQLYLTSLITKPLGPGSALVATALIPDRDHFSGRGGKDIIPLYRDRQSQEPNLVPGLLEVLGSTLGLEVTPEDFAAYVYGVLAHPGYTATFAEELEAEPGPRVPITRDPKLFEKVAAVGRELLWLHTFGERYGVDAWPPKGEAEPVSAIPHEEVAYPESFAYDPGTQTLRVGAGEIRPVSKAVWDYEISGWKPLQKWLKYRMKQPAGRTSSELDQIRPERWTAAFTEELLDLIRILERTVELNRIQRGLLDEVLASPLFSIKELGLDAIPDELRRPPPYRRPTTQRDLGF